MKLGRQWVAIDDLIADLRQIACSLLAHRDRRLLVPSSSTGVDLLTDPLAVRSILRALLVHAARCPAQGDVALRITADPYAVRFWLETCEEPAGRGANVPGITGETFLTLCQAERLARLLGGDVVAFEADGKRKLSFVLPHCDAVGHSLLRGHGQAAARQTASTLAA